MREQAQRQHPSFDSTMLLMEKLGGDVIIGSFVTAIVAPFLTVVDKALVQRSTAAAAAAAAAASTTTASADVPRFIMAHNMMDNTMEIVRHPLRYVKSPTFLWMWATYASTYSVANALKTLTTHHQYHSHHLPEDRRRYAENVGGNRKTISNSGKMVVFVGTGFTNTTASLVKDRAYAKLFGSSVASQLRSVPMASYGFWICRDFTVIGSSFILPDIVATKLQEHCRMNQTESTKLAQLMTPIVAQVIAGPLHYVGLDVFNRPLSMDKMNGPDWIKITSDRFMALRSAFGEVVVARMIRILPGYGIAGVWNRQLRDQYQERILRTYISRVQGQKRGSPEKVLATTHHRRELLGPTKVTTHG